MKPDRAWNSTFKQRTKPMRKKTLAAVWPGKRERVQGPPKPRKPLAKQSQRQKTRLAKYRPMARDFLAQPENEFCRCCIIRRERGEDRRVNYSTETHHKRGRAGSLLFDVRFFIPTCFDCGRNWIHQNPEKAREYNLLATASEWNSPEE